MSLTTEAIARLARVVAAAGDVTYQAVKARHAGRKVGPYVATSSPGERARTR
jgi:hypothetical protein